MTNLLIGGFCLAIGMILGGFMERSRVWNAANFEAWCDKQRPDDCRDAHLPGDCPWCGAV